MTTYNDLVNVEGFGERKQIFNEERGGVSFYCKNCELMVDTERKTPKGMEFICLKCKGNDIAIGTLEGLKVHFRINS